MPAINSRELRRMWEVLGDQKTHEHLSEAIQSKKLKPEDLSIRDLAESLVEDGREWVSTMDPRKQGSFELLEADAVRSSLFTNIAGQVVFSKIQDAFDSPEFVFTKLIPTIPTQFNGEKIPGISGLGDAVEVVDENKEYPLIGVTEDYIETPVTVKRGAIVPVTKEAIFFDRTGILLERCSKVGEALGLNKEKRIIDVIVDENTTAGRYKWRGTVIATYGDNSGTHSWDNLSASTALEDWTDVDAMELLLSNMLDPNTGEPIMVMADTLIVNPQLYHTALRVLNATEIRMAVGGYATSGNLTTTVAGNTIGNANGYSAPYQIVTSRLLPTRMATDTSWFLGNPRKAFAYMENWPLTTVQAPTNSHDEFHRDIVAQYKASERGATATLEPRYMCKATA